MKKMAKVAVEVKGIADTVLVTSAIMALALAVFIAGVVAIASVASVVADVSGSSVGSDGSDGSEKKIEFAKIVVDSSEISAKLLCMIVDVGR